MAGLVPYDVIVLVSFAIIVKAFKQASQVYLSVSKSKFVCRIFETSGRSCFFMIVSAVKGHIMLFLSEIIE